jgi:hypothetical protein
MLLSIVPLKVVTKGNYGRSLYAFKPSDEQFSQAIFR